MSITKSITKSLFWAMLLSTGCVMGEGFDAVNGPSSGDEGNDQGGGWADLDECKIENSDIGVVGLTLPLGRVSVTFTEWIAKDGEPGEYVGFSFSVQGADSVLYKVKAGGEVYPSQGNTWIHPRGTGGSDVSAISNVDFCDNPPDGGDGDPTDPTDGCTNPDGCDGGSGDGSDPTDPNGGGDCTNPDGCDGGSGDGGSGDPTDPDGGGDCTNPDGCDGGSGDGGSGDPTDPNGGGDCTNPDGCDGGSGDGGSSDPTDPGCTNPDGCDNNPGDGNTCTSNSDCATGEFCLEGTCYPVVL